MWFGTSGFAETTSVSQPVTTGPGTVGATLRFWMKTVAGDAPEDFTLDIEVDDVVVQTYTITATEANYTERTVNFFLLPGTHTIEFSFTSVIDDFEDVDSSFLIDDISLNVCTPTAATADISGRVLTSIGRGVANTEVTLTDEAGTRRTVRTNSFGFYSFEDVSLGVYVMSVSSRYAFSPQVVNLFSDMEGVNFVAGR
jgi:hypothetical protein